MTIHHDKLAYGRLSPSSEEMSQASVEDMVRQLNGSTQTSPRADGEKTDLNANNPDLNANNPTINAPDPNATCGDRIDGIKIAYIGGGSKMWARVFMFDLALTPEMCGEIALYDIDRLAAERNRQIGDRLNQHPETLSKWRYTVCDDLKDALTGATFVVLSILPGTFDDMQVDVHLPEKYGIFQAVGDTVGPGGVLRAMRTVPVYEEFARAIAQYCPKAWVINFTNPMTVCTRTLYGVFPQIKAFGCCHEVFHAEELLACVAHEILGVPRPDRHEITVDASGINHFTWITEASYKGRDLLSLLPAFTQKYFESGYCEQLGFDKNAHRGDNPFLYGNKVKLDLFRRFGALAAAGDRHLVEFMDRSWYLKNPAHAESWLYHLTPVSWRRADCERKVRESVKMAAGELPVKAVRSDEEATVLMKAVLGMGTVVSNVNMPNRGQMPDMPTGAVVETNCVFGENSVKPVTANPLPGTVTNLVLRNCMNIENCCKAISERDLDGIFEVFLNQPLLSGLDVDKARALFDEMVEKTGVSGLYLK